MKSLQTAFLAVLALACGAAFAGYPVMDMIPPDLAAALTALGGVPVAGTFKNRVTNIMPVAPGATATLTLGTGKNAPTLDKLQFILAGTTFTVANINAIRGFMNGREFYIDGTGTVHNGRRDYLGLYDVASELVIDFTEPNAKSAIEQNLSAIPLALLQDFRFELDIAAGASADLTLKCLAHFRAPTNNPFVKKQRKITQSFAAAGEQVIYMPNGPSGGKLTRVWIHESAAGNITAVELRARNAIGIEGTRTELQNSQQHNGLTPQAGVLVLDFVEDGNLAGWFDTSALSEVELKLTGTAAATYTVYLEYLDPIGRL